MPTVVYNHFEKLLKFLKAEGVVRNGSTIVCNTDESPDKFTKKNDGFMSMYHIYSCFEMGLQWIGFRRIPCICLSYRQQMR